MSPRRRISNHNRSTCSSVAPLNTSLTIDTYRVNQNIPTQSISIDRGEVRVGVRQGFAGVGRRSGSRRRTRDGALVMTRSSPGGDHPGTEGGDNTEKGHGGNMGGNNGDSEQERTGGYYEAVISEVRTAEGQGNVIFLKVLDGNNSILPVYIGEYECGALIKEMHKRTLPRPGTHDLVKNMMEVMGFRVSKVRITSLVGNIYHARIHMVSREYGRENNDDGGQGGGVEVDIDSRPSDAINMAARFGAPIYVNKEVASKMAHPGGAAGREMGGVSGGGEKASQNAEALKHANEIIQSCKEEILLYNDPTMMYKLQMQLAIAEERFEDATKLRDVIDKLLASDRSLSLVIAIETALEDQRFEEAARLRDELRAYRRAFDSGGTI